MLDTHAHFDFDDFDHDRHILFQQMNQQGITNVIIPGVSPQHWAKQIAIANEYKSYFALGIHPWFVPDDIGYAMVELDLLVAHHRKHSKLVAIGECGLDKLKGDFDKQYALLESQLKMAQTYRLPIILHVVKAHEELLFLLKKYTNPKGGVIHGFYGNIQLANRYIALGYKLGIGGLIMNPAAKKLRETIVQISIEHLLVETDSPSMTPINSPSSRNSPLNIPVFVTEIALLQKKTTVLVAEQLDGNAAQLFEL